MFGKKKKQGKSGSVFTMTLHNYQVEIADCDGKTVGVGNYDAFSAVEAIKSARKTLKENMLVLNTDFTLPLRFTTLIK